MKKNDLVGGGIFLALGVSIFLFTFSFPALDKGHPGPSLFPRILAILFIVFGGTVFLRGWKSGEADDPEEDTGPLNYFNPVFVLFLIAAYIFLSNWLGFLITSFAVLFLMMLKLRVSWMKGAVISVVLTLFVNLMFAKILRVPLPPGFLAW